MLTFFLALAHKAAPPTRNFFKVWRVASCRKIPENRAAHAEKNTWKLSGLFFFLTHNAVTRKLPPQSSTVSDTCCLWIYQKEKKTKSENAVACRRKFAGGRIVREKNLQRSQQKERNKFGEAAQCFRKVSSGPPNAWDKFQGRLPHFQGFRGGGTRCLSR